MSGEQKGVNEESMREFLEVVESDGRTVCEIWTFNYARKKGWKPPYNQGIHVRDIIIVDSPSINEEHVEYWMRKYGRDTKWEMKQMNANEKPIKKLVKEE